MRWVRLVYLFPYDQISDNPYIQNRHVEITIRIEQQTGSSRQQFSFSFVMKSTSSNPYVLFVEFLVKLFTLAFNPPIYLATSCVILFSIIIIIIVTYMLLHYGWLAFGRGSGWSVVYTICARVKETEKSSKVIFFLSRSILERGRASVPWIFLGLPDYE